VERYFGGRVEIIHRVGFHLQFVYRSEFPFEDLAELSAEPEHRLVVRRDEPAKQREPVQRDRRPEFSQVDGRQRRPCGGVDLHAERRELRVIHGDVTAVSISK
jgi:hypothetical protein